jgi:hypothetical protein
MLNATADRANVICSPTVIFAGILVVGFGLDMIWPASFLPEGWGFPLGLIVIFAAVNIKLFAVREMVRVKTNLDIRKPANDLATSGLYSASRNPLYIGMILLNIGIGCIVNSLWILLPPRACGDIARRDRTGRPYLEKKFGKVVVVTKRVRPDLNSRANSRQSQAASSVYKPAGFARCHPRGTISRRLFSGVHWPGFWHCPERAELPSPPDGFPVSLKCGRAKAPSARTPGSPTAVWSYNGEGARAAPAAKRRGEVKGGETANKLARFQPA